MTWKRQLRFIFLPFFFFKKFGSFWEPENRKKKTKKKVGLDLKYPYTPPVAQGGVSFPYVFLDSEPAQKRLWNFVWWIKMQYYYIEYETRGGVDVIPLLTVFEKRVFWVSVPFLQKTSIFRGEISGNFRGSGSQRRLNFHFFFFLFLLSSKT